jgi:hypothetical protein
MFKFEERLAHARVPHLHDIPLHYELARIREPPEAGCGAAWNIRATAKRANDPAVPRRHCGKALPLTVAAQLRRATRTARKSRARFPLFRFRLLRIGADSAWMRLCAHSRPFFI